MSNTQKRRRASDRRCARRSLVELTAAASRAIDDGLSEMSARLVAACPDDPPRSELAAKTSDRTIVATQAPAIPVTVHHSPNAGVSRSNELVDSDSVAEMFVNIAKDHQSRAFDSIKASLNAALDHAKAFAETRAGSEAASKDHGGAGFNNVLTVLEGAAAELRAETLELMKANVFTSLEYAREVVSIETTADFIELSSTQARKQCELFIKHAFALTSLVQTATKSNAH
jgi:hypothetical protein